jgi:beta-glucuronidase
MANSSANKRSRQSLDGNWFFNIDREEEGEKFGWNTAEYNHNAWGEYPVPGSWDTYLPELFGYGGTGWFRRSFALRPSWKGRRIHLRFDGANYATTVWVNGKPAGEHRGGFDPFEFNITDLVTWDGPNQLAIRVDNWPKLNRVPNSFAGWWNYGGIYRSVTLLALPEVRVSDVFVHSSGVVDGEPLKVDIEVVNESSQVAEISVQAAIFSESTEELILPSEKIQVLPGTKASVTLSTAMADPELWSPESPTLYGLQVDLWSNRRLLDRTDLQFGVRKFEVRGTQLRLNNQPIFLTGFDRHEEYVNTGRVDTEDQLIDDVRWIQRLNGNMVRMHYQAHPRLYELADQLGLLVFAEIPAWQIGVKDVKEWENPEVWQTTETMMRTLVHELKNHPSVVIWSVGNECATDKPESRPLIKHLVDLTREMDASRPVAMVGMYAERDLFHDLVDLPCMNTYSRHDQAGLRKKVESIHALSPGKPLLITEFGAEGLFNLHGENYLTEEEQASIIADHWQVFMEYPEFVCGALIWCLADYWHMPMGPDYRWGINRHYFCHGVLTLDRLPKAAAQMAANLYKTKVNPGQ